MYKKISILFLLGFVFFNTAFAYDMNSPVGNWINVNDETGERTSIVKISEQNGTLYGKVIKVFPGSSFAGVCDKCEGALKNTPIKGMTVLWGFTQAPDGQWVNGKILNPDTGKVYDRKMMLIKNGQQLQLHNVWNLSRRTQTWVRGID